MSHAEPAPSHAPSAAIPGAAGLPTPDGRGEVLLTAAEHAAYVRELERLREVLDHELPQLRREARTYVSADAAEELGQIGDRQAVVETRIARLEHLLSRVRVVSGDEAAAGVVTLGCVVEVEYLDTGKVVSYRIAGVGAGLGDGGEPGVPSVSARSPVGQALMGGTPGSVVRAELPGGRHVELRIRSVRAGGAGADAPPPADQPSGSRA